MRPSPNAPLGHLSSTDRALFYQYGIGPSRAVHIPVIHHSFEHHARTQPQAIAVEDTPSNQTITFAGLDVCSDRLAHVLRKNNIRPGARVCILARRSIPLVAGILAILKSGGQYVPLDAVTITDDTLQFVLEDATPTVVLCMEEFRHRLDFSAVPVISLEPTLAEEEEKNPTPSKVEDIVTPEDGAYCIYTSGTTGRPKGVDVRHRGVTNVISGSPGNVGMRPGLRVAQLLNIAFDMGAWEILGSLYNGCTLCLRGNRFKEWVALLKTVDVVIATPSILTCHDPADYPNLKHVIVGGEPCPQTLADKWARHTQFNNCCGPTEISICNTVQPHTPGYSLSIGKPIPNTNVYILGRDPMNTRANAIGQVGCMWVGGIGVSNGYLNMPEKTAERWRKDPFIEGGMMFNTGDLGRWRKDGQLEHMGRADDQVKVKGFRIELDGVTMAMRTHEPVKNAVALLVGSELCGFVTPSTVDLTAVREATAKIQPYYAVPTRFLALEEFPMTRNGKIDKRELHALADAEKQRQALSSNPSSPTSPSGATSRITSPTGSTAISPSASTITERTTQKDASTHRRLPSITSVSITTTITSEGYAPDHSSFLLGATSETLTAAALFGMGDSAWNWKSPSRLTVVLLFITLGLCSRSLSSFLSL